MTSSVRFTSSCARRFALERSNNPKTRFGKKSFITFRKNVRSVFYDRPLPRGEGGTYAASWANRASRVGVASLPNLRARRLQPELLYVPRRSQFPPLLGERAGVRADATLIFPTP